MNMQTLKKSIVCFILLTHVIAFTLPSAQAAPGTLSSAPLYLSTAVEPNIMFLLDDSGSMDWEFLVQGAADGIPSFGGLIRFYVLPSANNVNDSSFNPAFPYTVPSVALVPDAWRARNSSFNTLYYNPGIAYTPWDGVNAVSAALYANATATAALVNPLNSADGTLDLTTTKNFTGYVAGAWVADSVFPAHHYLWTDTNSNGVVDAADARTLVEIRPATPTYTKTIKRTDCAGATCSYAEEIQNFANWYTYYRKRAYAAKKALGNLIDKTSGTRMGLFTFNNGLVTNATSMNTAANKLTLLQNTYARFMSGGTPARSALQALGDLYEGASSPILSSTAGGTCQQNFSVVTTDGFWNGADPTVGNTDGGTSNSSFDGGAYADSYANTLADVAMHYYERDLKPSLANSVPTTAGVDLATHQHMVTYTVAFGVTGTLNPATADPKATGFTWPDPFDAGVTQAVRDARRIDDTWHAAYNGRGLFLSASDPDTLSTSLGNAIANIEERSSSAAAVAFNSTSLNVNSVVYQAQFNSTKWSGELLAFDLDPNNGNISSTPLWNAAPRLNAQLPANRVMLTYNPTTNLGIPFTWDTTALSATQQSDLNKGTAAADARGADRVAYLRGDRSNEGSGSTDFRIRSTSNVLGDIAHSEPVYVGGANQSYPDVAPFPIGTNAYSVFKTSQASRAGVVYVGANDGMLHGFSAATGDEVIAYAPHNLFSANASEGLHYLTEKTYVHRYYVDLGATVTDAYTKSTPSGAVGWKTVLVGGQRGGGRGLFALDVTNPSAFSQSSTVPDDIVMWEFTHADLGYTYSKPAIALMNNGRWAAIFGNGYNDTGNGKAQIFIVYLDGGLDGVWTLGTDYLVITTDVGTITARNGLASPSIIDLNNDRVVDRIYAGDLQGNMWVFDVSNATATNWGVAYKTGTTPKPLFTALNAAGVAQPITTKPAIARHASVAFSNPNSPNLMVYFGTGQYIAVGDSTSTATQTFYGVWDHGTKNLLRANLTPQTITTSGSSRTLTSTAVNYASKDGWYIDLNTSSATTGERVAVDPLVRDDEVHFNTLIPSSTVCSFGGSGWIMRVNRDTGGAPATPAFDTNADGIINSSDSNTGGMLFDGIMSSTKILGDSGYTSDSTGKINKTLVKKLKKPVAGRQSWREIIN